MLSAMKSRTHPPSCSRAFAGLSSEFRLPPISRFAIAGMTVMEITRLRSTEQETAMAMSRKSWPSPARGPCHKGGSAALRTLGAPARARGDRPRWVPGPTCQQLAVHRRFSSDVRAHPRGESDQFHHGSHLAGLCPWARFALSRRRDNSRRLPHRQRIEGAPSVVGWERF